MGFDPIHESNWPSCYYHSELKLVLSVYVDDFKMSGPTKNLAKGWNLIRHQAGLVLEDPLPAHLYLGCIHEKRTVQLAGGRSAQAVVYNMESYFASAVSKYCKLAQSLVGKEIKLKKVATPFLPEDHSSAESRVPACGGNAVSCPWCKRVSTLSLRRNSRP